ncbi:V-set and immunoglobulin domain-containing protein 1-like [Ambystoma mexicanum]|uniref:V-set and immunoglobulin domain-containing protein 1-like n=1 Tax=Ambystoma mexicanum TaxID=8296 RepID=UPI0037E9B5F2
MAAAGANKEHAVLKMSSAVRLAVILWLTVGLVGAGAALATVSMQQQFTARSGDDVHLPCLVSEDMRPVNMNLLTVHWSKDGNIKATFENGISTVALQRMQLRADELERGNASLVIGQVTHADAGLYVCTVTYGKKTMTTRMSLTVKAADPPSVVDTSLQVDEVIGQNGYGLVLWCLFRVTPQPVHQKELTTRWIKKNGKKDYSPTFHEHLQPETDGMWNATLVIDQLMPADAGSYHCLVTYQNKENEMCKIILKVEDPPNEASPRHLASPTGEPKQWTQRYMEVGMVVGILATACGVALIIAVCYRG